MSVSNSAAAERTLEDTAQFILVNLFIARFNLIKPKALLFRSMNGSEFNCGKLFSFNEITSGPIQLDSAWDVAIGNALERFNFQFDEINDTSKIMLRH